MPDKTPQPCSIHKYAGIKRDCANCTPADKTPQDYIRRIVPPKMVLSASGEIPNPAHDVPTYELITVAQYEDEQKADWYEKHKRADVLVVNQSGAGLYALYKSPEASHDEMAQRFFKQLRADRLNEWEYEDE